LALGFLLGGIISPPDAVAAASVLKGMPVPKRLLTILEGESLVNDASSLIVFKFALMAVVTGVFSMKVAVGQFFIVAGLGIVLGLVGAALIYLVHRFLPTTPAIDAALTVMTPYILFLFAEEFHYSGVMAVVSGGLFMSYRSHEVFQTGRTRVNMLGVSTTLIFVMNALVFILIGLELPEIILGLGEDTLWTGIRYGLIISILIICLRFMWVFPAAHLPRWLSASARKDPSPGWKGPLVISWAGMRGGASLATALSIPLMVSEDHVFPYRSLIILITFVVTLVTLVFQGLTLPYLIKRIHLGEIDSHAPNTADRVSVQLHLNALALAFLEERNVKSEWVQAYRRELGEEDRYLHLLKERPEESRARQEFELLLLEIYAQQRRALFRMRQEKKYSDEVLREMEMQLNINELQITGSSH
jgi:Na+/H+ antiporter